MPNEHRNPTQEERDERVKLPLDPEVAVRALLAVDPDDDDGDEPVLAVGQVWQHKSDRVDLRTVQGPIVNLAPDMWSVLVSMTGKSVRMTAAEIVRDYVLVDEA